MGAAPLPFLLERVLGVSAPLPLSEGLIHVEPHLGGLPAAAGVVGTEWGPVGVSWDITGGPWYPPWPRSVLVHLNASIAKSALSLKSSTRSHGAATLTALVALPLDDPTTPAPTLSDLSRYCIDVEQDGGAVSTLNVTQAVATGKLILDADARYLRYPAWTFGVDKGAGTTRGHLQSDEAAGPAWLQGPPLMGLYLTSTLQLRLYAPAGGAGCMS
jgi:hypothetical protein